MIGDHSLMTEAHLGPIKKKFLIRYTEFPNSLYRIKFVITNSRIRYNEFRYNEFKNSL